MGANRTPLPEPPGPGPSPRERPGSPPRRARRPMPEQARVLLASCPVGRIGREDPLNIFSRRSVYLWEKGKGQTTRTISLPPPRPASAGRAFSQGRSPRPPEVGSVLRGLWGPWGYPTPGDGVGWSPSRPPLVLFPHRARRGPTTPRDRTAQRPEEPVETTSRCQLPLHPRRRMSHPLYTVGTPTATPCAKTRRGGSLPPGP